MAVASSRSARPDRDHPRQLDTTQLACLQLYWLTLVAFKHCTMEDFYRGKSIFITGATGFVGKVILEKILRSLDVDKIYILIRPKRGCSPADRLITDVIESKIWERLHAERPDAAALIQSKLVAVGGDMLGDNLGLSPEDLHIIRTQCQILIHCAATVSFEEPLDVAINMNTLGALRVMSVAHSMERLESYVHVSTCYVNCDKHVPLIEEKVRAHLLVSSCTDVASRCTQWSLSQRSSSARSPEWTKAKSKQSSWM